jgi:iron complex outermembrane receptor protein
MLLLVAAPAVGAEPVAPNPAQGSTEGESKAIAEPDRRPKVKPKAKPEAVVEVLGVASPVLQESRLDSLASTVSVVSSQQIADLQAQDLPSALRSTPGVVISRHNPVGSFGGGEGGSVFIRGMGISRPGAEIQILMDGVPKAVGVWTHPLMDTLSVDVMNQVEVHKGAQPVFFGNSAFGAVSITTKSMQEEGSLTSLEAAGGSFRTGVEVLQHGGKHGAFDYYLVQSFRRSDGHREASGGELQNYFGRMGYAFSEHWKASLMLNATDNWADDPGPADGLTPRQGRFKTHDLLSVATLSNHYEGAEGHLKVYREEGQIRWGGQYNSATRLNDVATNTNWENSGVRAKEAFKPWQGGEVILGVDLDFIRGKVENLVPPAAPNRFAKTTFRILSQYLALNHTFGSRDGWYVVPSAGARFLDHSEFGRATGTQAGLAGGYRDTEVHASLAHGLNYPGIYVKAQDQMFMPGDNRWQDLRPETVTHQEMGLSQRFGKLARLEVNLFQDEGKDRIVVAPPPPFPPVFTNFGTWKTQGVEVAFTIAPHANLAFFAGGTYLDATPRDLPYAPRKSGTMGANYRFLEHFQFSADLLYVDGQFVTSRARTKNALTTDRVGAYALVNAKLTWDFVRNAACVGQMFLALENLGNRIYEQKKGYPMPGINGLAGIKMQF